MFVCLLFDAGRSLLESVTIRYSLSFIYFRLRLQEIAEWFYYLFRFLKNIENLKNKIVKIKHEKNPLKVLGTFHFL